MALTATATQGFEPFRLVAPDEVLYQPGDPSDTYTRGHGVVSTAGEGVLDVIAADEVMVGTVQQTIVCPANTVAFPFPIVSPWKGQVDDTATQLTLIPIRPCVQVGTQVYLATFQNQLDDTVVTYSAANRYIEMTTGAAADDYPNGAYVYVYEGTGAGQINVVEDYDHTGGTVELMLTLHRPFAVALDTTSKFIVVSGEAATNKGVGAFGRCAIGAAGKLDVNDGANDGEFTVYCDWRELADHLKNLRLPVVKSAAILMA